MNSLEDDFRWANDNFDSIGDLLVEDKNGVIRFGSKDGPFVTSKLGDDCVAELFTKNVGKLTVSLSYAGIDAPGCSLMMSVACARSRGHDARKPTIVRAIEYDAPCQRELRGHPCAPLTLFGDLDEFWLPQIKSAFRALRSAGKAVTLDSMLPLIHSRSAVMKEGFDLITKSMRPLTTTDIEIAGVNCKPFAPMGKQQGESSPEMSAVGAWAALQLVLSPKTILVEESSLFEVGILNKMLSSQYVFQALILDGINFGHPVRRQRLACRRASLPPLSVRTSVYDFTNAGFGCWSTCFAKPNHAYVLLRPSLFMWLSVFAVLGSLTLTVKGGGGACGGGGGVWE